MWLEAHILKNITAPVTIDTLRQVFSIHGLPDVVVSDNGPTFTGEFFQEFLKKNGIRHIRTAPFHPASNGLAERAVQTLKEGLKKMSGANIETNLSRFLFQYRITPQTTTGLAPAEMLLGRKPKSHLDLLHPDVGEKVRVQQEKQKAWHDRHARERSFREGEAVFVRNFARGQRWLPGSIVKESGPRSCVVRLSDGREVRRMLGPQQLPSTQSLEGTVVQVPVETPLSQDSVPTPLGESAETVRRSKRQKKAPQRLNL
uniref:Integrase catalytic domain-containing protein n=1 Tax=Cyprinus carpio TaxID=7962 RepID=A0A8C1UFQ7_CYPCA